MITPFKRWSRLLEGASLLVLPRRHLGFSTDKVFLTDKGYDLGTMVPLYWSISSLRVHENGSEAEHTDM